MVKIADLCDAFIHDCQIVDKSEKTVKLYMKELYNLQTFFANLGVMNAKDLTVPNLRTFFFHQKNSRNLGPVTTKKLMAVVRSLCRFAVENNIYKESPMIYIDSPRLPKYIPDVLSTRELNEIFATTDNLFSLNNSVLVRFLAGTGVRRAELIGVKWKDINIEKKFVMVRGKGNKKRCIPLGSSLVKFLQKLKNNTSFKEDSEVFLDNNKPYNKDSLSKKLQQIINGTVIKKKVTLHTFRRTFATHLIESGVSIFVVQKLLGHEDIRSTQKYTFVSIKTLIEAVAKLSL